MESEEQESLSTHYFKVDALVDNVTLLITGTLSECILTSPSGDSTAGPQRNTPMTNRSLAVAVVGFYHQSPTRLFLLSSLEQSQPLPSEQGPLAEMKSFKGLYRVGLLLPIEAGQWKLQVRSDGHLTFSVLGTRMVLYEENQNFCFLVHSI